MKIYDIPTAEYVNFTSFDDLIKFFQTYALEENSRYKIKYYHRYIKYKNDSYLYYSCNKFKSKALHWNRNFWLFTSWKFD